MQGRIVTRDLAENGYRVFISGRSRERLEKLQAQYPVAGLKTADLGNKRQLKGIVEGVKPAVIINCAEGDWNVDVYQAALEGEANVIDLGSEVPATKIQLAMSKDFKKKGLTAITGCGSTPGVNNVTLSYAVSQLDTVETIEVGFAWNSNIKKFVVPFSMKSIVEEFTDLAPLIKNEMWLEKEPLKTVKNRKFRWVGRQKIFLVKHPETFTFFHYFKNRGLKNVLFLAGFPEHSFNKIISYTGKNRRGNLVYENGSGFVSLNNLTRILQKKHRPPKGYKEVENLWVVASGIKDGKKKNIFMECIVPTLKGWESAGCNIDTGFPASIIGQMIWRGEIKQCGSFAPEVVVPYGHFFQDLKRKGMSVWQNGKWV